MLYSLVDDRVTPREANLAAIAELLWNWPDCRRGEECRRNQQHNMGADNTRGEADVYISLLKKEWSLSFHTAHHGGWIMCANTHTL